MIRFGLRGNEKASEASNLLLFEKEKGLVVTDASQAIAQRPKQDDR